ncbi:phosphoribosylaminoimidazole carboxylase ATPase subunit [Legionella nautarum]|uniref:N5-carboxyaminoimidazole ribonucleotide synthase n=1 Tax=Legionella nautarum TaxID=45070 RepID=A0A0W0WZF3_9GAMM|nr:5-(carboxyamino)imidazole ribonucleotide synthase [Legionella nautarum]KTD37692.1 phosphoribosylaminoimidazole carboxylase ATPase subunit [Legionella nautarum]
MKLGILGAGQLAKMLAIAGHYLGIRTLCFAPDTNPCASDVTRIISGSFSDEKLITAFCNELDCVTFETENIPLACANTIGEKVLFYPPIKALKISQDRLLEKKFLNSLAIKTARFVAIETLDQLSDIFISWKNSPAVLKTRRLGYDGKGQYVLHQLSDIEKAWKLMQSNDLILEQFVPYEGELSLIAVRNKQGETRFYPLIKNQHYNGILHWSEASLANNLLQQKAESIVKKIMDALEYVGVMTVEFFHHNGDLIVNEIAPRVHNSGHLTIEGAMTSQFENHLRAIFSLPLGNTEFLSNCFLVNCLGNMFPIEDCLNIPGVHYHNYGKKSYPNRKVGHITLFDHDLNRYEESKLKLMKMINDSILPVKS